MILKLLVIDDRITERRESYSALLRQACRHSGFEIRPIWVEHPADLHRLVLEHRIGMALIDAVLEGEPGPWERYTMGAALETLGPDIRFAIVSSQWQRTRADEMNKAWESPQCLGFFHWRDIESGGSGDFNYAVAQLTKLIHRAVQTAGLQDTCDPGDSLSIVHLSDLQIGGFAPARIKLEASAIAEKVRTQLRGHLPSFIVLTGDVAQRGQPQEYEGAREWLTLLCRRLGFSEVPRDRVLLCPGNHDFNLALAAASRVTVHDNPATKALDAQLVDEVLHPQLLEYALRPYREFAETVSCHHFLDSASWVELRFRHLGIVFYGLSSLELRARGAAGRRVDPDSLERVKARIHEVIGDAQPRPLIVGLVHHSPYDGAGASAVENLEDFSTFLSSQEVPTGLFLYGHVHMARPRLISDQNTRIVTIAAPSPSMPGTARNEDTFRGFNLYQLARDRHAISSMTVHSFGWSSQRLQPLFEPRRFEFSTNGTFWEKG